MPRITFNLNGKAVDAPYEPGMHFLEVLREECGVVSAKDGCAPEGTCGCCLVMVDGHPALSCLRKPEQMDGREVVTRRGPSRRHAADPERSVRPRRRRAVRVLHPGDSRPRGVVDGAGPDRRSARGREGARRPSLPLHRLRPDPRRHPDRRRRVAARRVAAEHRAAAAFLFRRRARACAAIPRSPPATGRSGNGHDDGIGRSIARHGGLEQALGEKPFVDDMRVPGMLHGAMVLTEHPRAKILKIHTEEAAAMPGVVRVFTAADVPGNRGTGLNDPDQPVFVAEGELTCCVADFLAMVVADTRFHARRAAADGDGRLRGARTDHRSVRGAGTRRPAGAFGGDLRAETVERAPADDRLRARRRGRRARDRRACDRGDVRHAADRHRVPRAGSLPGGAAARHGVKVHTESQGSVYDHAQIARILNLDPEGRRDCAGGERRRLRRERGAVDSGRRPRLPPTCCSGRSRPCSRVRSRRSTTSSAMR